jgi:hypothetical protein
MKPERVVFVRTGALGDFVLSLPLLATLCREDAPVFLVSRPGYRQILSPGVWVAGMLDAGSPAALALFSRAEPFTEPLRSWLRLAEVHFFSNRDPATEARLLGQGRACRCVWHDPRPVEPPHVAIRFLEAAGRPVPADLLARPLWEPTGEGQCLWLHPGSGSRSKNYPLSVFAKLAAAWCHNHRSELTLSFGEADVHLVSPCRREFSALGLQPRLVLNPSLGQLKALLAAEAALFIGNDSGVTHLASALGVPTIALFRRTDPRIWRPMGRCLALPTDLGTGPAPDEVAPRVDAGAIIPGTSPT